MSAPTGRLFRSETFSEALRAYVIATGVFRFVGFLRGIVLTWFMVRGEYGLFYITLLVVNVLTPLCSVGLNDAVARYVPTYETKGQLQSFLKGSFFLLAGTGALLTCVALLEASTLARWMFSTFSLGSVTAAEVGDKTLLLTRLAAFAVLAHLGYFLIIAILKGLRMFRALGLMECVNAVLFTTSALICVVKGYQSASTVMLCYTGAIASSTVLFGLPLARFLSRWESQQAPLEESGLARRLFAFSLWTAFAAIIWQALQYYPMWYLNKSHGAQITGTFGSIRHLAQFVYLASFALTTVVMTVVTKTWETQGSRSADRQLSLACKAVLLSAFLGCAVLVIGRRLLIALLHPDYHDGVRIVAPQLAFFLLTAQLTFLSIHFNLIEKTRMLAWPWCVGMCANVLFALRWVAPTSPDPLRGAADAGVMGMAAAMVTCFMLLWAERRPVGRGEVVVVASAALLYANPAVLVAGCLLLAGLACFTPLIFDDDERGQIRLLIARCVASALRRRECGDSSGSATSG